MKQTFPAFSAGNMNITLNEITVGEALSLAKLDQLKRERQLSSFLSYALKNNELPYTMATQQRYFCLLNYLNSQKNNDLAMDVNVNDYINAEGKEWKDSVTVGDLSVRQLNGCEIEALEIIAEDIGDWVLGAMALQITLGDELPYIQPLTDRILAGNVIKSRYELLLSFGQDRINSLYSQYQQAEDELSSLVTIGYDNEGIVLFETNGGRDSEPARFQCDSSVTGFTKQLFSALAEGSTEASA